MNIGKPDLKWYIQQKAAQNVKERLFGYPSHQNELPVQNQIKIHQQSRLERCHQDTQIHSSQMVSEKQQFCFRLQQDQQLKNDKDTYLYLIQMIRNYFIRNLLMIKLWQAYQIKNTQIKYLELEVMVGFTQLKKDKEDQNSDQYWKLKYLKLQREPFHLIIIKLLFQVKINQFIYMMSNQNRRKLLLDMVRKFILFNGIQRIVQYLVDLMMKQFLYGMLLVEMKYLIQKDIIYELKRLDGIEMEHILLQQVRINKLYCLILENQIQKYQNYIRIRLTLYFGIQNIRIYFLLVMPMVLYHVIILMLQQNLCIYNMYLKLLQQIWHWIKVVQ